MVKRTACIESSPSQSQEFSFALGGVHATTVPMLLLRLAFAVLLVATSLLNCYLYYYPVLNSCDFPPTDSLSTRTSWIDSLSPFQRRHASPSTAPFRLLAFGDPQLEGDTSLPFSLLTSYHPSTLAQNLRNASSVTARYSILRSAATDFLGVAVPAQLRAWRKRLDLFGNDHYLAHIYRSVARHSAPTHVAVLGDLLGSQWIDDAEFERRAQRYWGRVFRHGQRVEDEITAEPTIEELGEDPAWNRRVIAVTGNHDVGYAGDMTTERVVRFERAFGRANWEIVFRIPSPRTKPSSADAGEDAESAEDAFLRLVILNSMNLDTPAKEPELQAATYGFLNEVISRSQPVEDRRVGTLLLTHIPLHKEAGVCADGPFFDFHGEEDGRGVKEQNHLSYEVSRGAVLEGLFGMSGHSAAPWGGLGRQGLVLTGHDHEGCDVYHHLPRVEPTDESGERRDDATRRWNATRWENAEAANALPLPGIREITLRSMMGEFGGWAYFISAWFEDAEEENAEALGETWRFEVARCAIGVQHWWWAGQVLIIITAGLGMLLAVLAGLPGAGKQEASFHTVADEMPNSPSAESQDEPSEVVKDGNVNGAAPHRESGYVKKRRR